MTQYISNTAQSNNKKKPTWGLQTGNTQTGAFNGYAQTTPMYGKVSPAVSTGAVTPMKSPTQSAPAVWGMPQTDISKVSAVNFNTANTTPQTNVPPAKLDYKTGNISNPYNPPPSGTTTTQTPAQDGVRGIIPPPGSATQTPPPAAQKDSETGKGKTTKFGETVEGIIKKSDVNKDQQKMLEELRARVKSGENIADAARAISEKYATEIARVGKLGAGAVAGAMSTGTNVVGSGNAAIASQSASERMNALSTAQQAELAGNNQQLTANTQGISALTNALGAANTQQQLGISGLGTAAGYMQPSTAAYGQAVFNPLTGQYEGGGTNGMDPQSQASNLAQQVMSGAMTYDQAIASLGYAGNAGTNFLNNAITAAGGNPLVLQAQGTAQQSNITTGGTAQTDIARIGLADATQNYVQMNTAAQYATQQSHAVSNILEKTGLNNVSSTDYNKAINSLQSRFSDVDFQAFNTALIEAQNAYSQLLSIGGVTPSGSEASALATLNSSQSAAAINASIRELDAAVQRRLQSQYSAMQTYQQNMPAGTPAAGGGNYQGGNITWESLLD